MSFFSQVALTMILLIMLDMLWFQVSVPTIYDPMFTRINSGSGYISVPSAIITWLLIAVLLNRFAKSYTDALTLGLLTYGIYNFTNYATIKKWTLSTVIADTLWGGVVCMTAFLLLPKISQSSI